MKRGRPFDSLRSRGEFDRVFHQGRKVRCGPFTLVVRKLPGSYRVGFKIGRRFGNSVLRNQIRRRFRAVFEDFVPGEGAGLELVVLASPGTESLSYRRLHSLVAKALTREGFLPRLPATPPEALP